MRTTPLHDRDRRHLRWSQARWVSAALGNLSLAATLAALGLGSVARSSHAAEGESPRPRAPRPAGRPVAATGMLAWVGASPAKIEPETTPGRDPAVFRTLATDPDPPSRPSGPEGKTTREGPVPRVASVVGHDLLARPHATDPIELAKQAIADCQKQFGAVSDYSCTFSKRERMGGRLAPHHVMIMKARTHPKSIYFKFKTPNQGREAIYVEGRHGNRVIAHDVGLFKVLAGTMHLDPKGTMAMEDCRHPVTEAGIGALIDTVARHWNAELRTGESQVVFHLNARVGNRTCTMIETTHPQPHPNFLFHKVKLYIDQEHKLPIRFEAYDWPKQAGATPELVEEYTYLDLRINSGLTERDFDPANAQYSFGRF
jgi:hypothetical protein